MSNRIAILVLTLAAGIGSGTDALAQNSAPRILEPAAFSELDYPIGALAAHEEGTVVLDLSVSPNGVVSDARVATSTGSDALDQASVRVAKGQWRFAPAMQNGQPVAGNIQVEANWSLPLTATDHAYIQTPDSQGATMAVPRGPYDARYTDYPPAAAAGNAQGVVGVRYQVDAAGNVTDAEVVESSDNFRFDAAALRIARNRSFTPASRGGTPVPVWQSLTVSFSILPANAAKVDPPCYARPVLGRDAVVVGATPYRVEVWFDSAKYWTRWETRSVRDWIGTWVQVSETGQPTEVILYTDGGWMVPSDAVSRRLTEFRDYPTGRNGCWYFDPISILG